MQVPVKWDHQGSHSLCTRTESPGDACRRCWVKVHTRITQELGAAAPGLQRPCSACRWAGRASLGNERLVCVCAMSFRLIQAIRQWWWVSHDFCTSEKQCSSDALLLYSSLPSSVGE